MRGWAGSHCSLRSNSWVSGPASPHTRLRASPTTPTILACGAKQASHVPAPGPKRTETFAAGVAGEVKLLQTDDNTLTVKSVTLSSGWTDTVTVGSGTSVRRHLLRCATGAGAVRRPPQLHRNPTHRDRRPLQRARLVQRPGGGFLVRRPGRRSRGRGGGRRSAPAGAAPDRAAAGPPDAGFRARRAPGGNGRMKREITSGPVQQLFALSGRRVRDRVHRRRGRSSRYRMYMKDRRSTSRFSTAAWVPRMTQVGDSGATLTG